MPLVFAQAHIEVLEEQIVRETSRRKELEELLGFSLREGCQVRQEVVLSVATKMDQPVFF